MLPTQIYRASTSAFVVFAFIFGVPGALLACVLLAKHQSLLPVLIPLAGYSLTAYWLLRFRLTFASDRVTYQSLFSPTCSILYSEIRSVGRANYRATESPLIISVRDVTGNELRINAKVFPIEAVRKLNSLAPRVV
jgi:hypothetical protein